VCAGICSPSRDTRPILALGIATVSLAILIVAGLGLTVARLRPPMGGFEVGQFIQVLEAGINDLVLIGAAIFFLGTLEGRIKRRMTSLELGRYLDYCSEMLSLTGKVAALYVQHFDDRVALQAVNEIEDLTTGLSSKIWQKLMILSA